MSQQSSSTLRLHGGGLVKDSDTPLGRVLVTIVDVGLIGVPLAGPWFMGGRHPLGELVVVVLAVVVASAWLARQALAKQPLTWTHSPAQWILAATVTLVLLQLAHLPSPAFDLLSPHTGQLLPLWRGSPSLSGTLGTWDQISMVPDQTQAGLTLLLAYGMLFLVAVQRLQRIDDVEWLLRWIAISVAVQAVFGIVQYLTSNGKFVWIYQHPFRDSHNAVMGAFINKNHFAHLMALGLGPLVWLVVTALQPIEHRKSKSFGSSQIANKQTKTLVTMLALGIVLFAGLMTLSRGGSMAMLIATCVVVGALFRMSMLSKRFVISMAGIFLLIGVSLVIHGYSKVAERLDDYSSGSLDELDQGGARRAIWQADFKALKDYSLFGSGVGSHREIYPMYLNEPWEVEFTHGENGPLQITLETGWPGLALLLAGIVICIGWCYRALRVNHHKRIYLCAAAVTAGLVASVGHSFVDFVWYIPSLMAITTLLMACACRLAQWSSPEQTQQADTVYPAWQYSFALIVVVVTSSWMVLNRYCAAMAESHWDRYLAYALKDPGDGEKPLADKSVVEALEQVVYWTPNNARAHVRLADLMLHEFEHRQRESSNAMPLGQISEAVLASRSHFTSRTQLDAWLNRAIGNHRRLLDQALWHLHRGLSQCPLMGEAYIHLADLCFLEGHGDAEKTAYMQQALKVRPYDGIVLLAAGSAAALRNDINGMIAYWGPVLRCRQQERLAMVKLLTMSPVSVETVLQFFQPDLAAVRLMYVKYNQIAPPEQLQPLYAYYAEKLQTATRNLDAEAAAPLWFEMHDLYLKMNRPQDGIECLKRAAVGRPSDFEYRLVLGIRLTEQRAFVEAEQHLNWCAQRRPQDGRVKEALAKAIKGRVDLQSGSAAHRTVVR